MCYSYNTLCKEVMVMISFHELTLNNEKPVYLQLADYVKKKIFLEEIKDGDELPSRRELAGTLGINPNTVQKAYKELESQGILTTSSNVKSVVAVNSCVKDRIKEELKKEATLKYIEYLKSINLSFKEAIELLTELWE